MQPCDAMRRYKAGSHCRTKPGWHPRFCGSGPPVLVSPAHAEKQTLRCGNAIGDAAFCISGSALHLPCGSTRLGEHLETRRRDRGRAAAPRQSQLRALLSPEALHGRGHDKWRAQYAFTPAWAALFTVRTCAQSLVMHRVMRGRGNSLCKSTVRAYAGCPVIACRSIICRSA